MSHATATGDNYTTAELRTLGRYRHLGLAQYRDLDGYYHLDCDSVVNVKCMSCGIWSEKHHGVDSEKVFQVDRPIDPIKLHGLYWTKITCLKCDFSFRVIVR